MHSEFTSAFVRATHNPVRLVILVLSYLFTGSGPLTTIFSTAYRNTQGPPMQSALPIQLGAVEDLQELRRSLTGKIFLTVSAAAFVALCAHVSLPLYYTPVPLTLQTFAVILVGLTLGPALGCTALLLYLAEGAMGVPVFSPHGPGGIAQLLGPSAGFLLAFPLAAAAAGGVVRAVRLGRTHFLAALLSGSTASFLLFAMGASWMAHLLHLNPRTAWQLAVAPFLPGEILKVSAAAGAYTMLRRCRRT
jgi:biotin transport system substrate-specific component